MFGIQLVSLIIPFLHFLFCHKKWIFSIKMLILLLWCIGWSLFYQPYPEYVYRILLGNIYYNLGHSVLYNTVQFCLYHKNGNESLSVIYSAYYPGCLMKLPVSGSIGVGMIERQARFTCDWVTLCHNLAIVVIRMQLMC